MCVSDAYQSGYNPCHANVPQLLEAVKRGVLLQGALPVPFPTISLHESFAYPTSMFLRYVHPHLICPLSLPTLILDSPLPNHGVPQPWRTKRQVQVDTH